MLDEQSIKKKLYQCYREFIQFLNQPFLNPSLLLIFFSFQAFCIITLFLNNLSQKPQIIDLLNKFEIGISLFNIANKTQFHNFCVILVVLLLLLSPIYVLLTALKFSLKFKYIENSYFRRSCEKSILLLILKGYLQTFQFISFPILISFALRINSFKLSIFIILTCLLIILMINFHSFEVERQEDSQKIALIRTNFPNKQLDSVLLFAIIVVLVLVKGMPAFYTGLVLVAMRFGISLQFEYFQKIVNRNYQYVLFQTVFICAAILLAEVLGSLIIIGFSLVLVCFIHQKNQLLFPIPSFQAIPDENESESIDFFLERLYKQGKFASTFGLLIKQSRKNNSYRDQLLIQILKAKCQEVEISLRQQGTKNINCQTVIRFEQLMKKFSVNFVEICDSAGCLLKFLKGKDPKPFIFQEECIQLIDVIRNNKIVMNEMVEINRYSKPAFSLFLLQFSVFFKDSVYNKKLDSLFHNNIKYTNEKTFKEYYFSDQTFACFINVLNQFSKIVKVSKNLTAILGYSSRQIVGASIDQIIPFSLRNHHTKYIKKFMSDFNKKICMQKMEKRIQFYAFHKQFVLQEISIKYNFVMSNFQTFSLCGIVQRVNNQKQLILTDQHGNIEGWTSQMGKKLGFNEMNSSNCRKFNIYPLVPALVKYGQSDICLKTLFFRPTSMLNQKLRICNFMNVTSSPEEIAQKAIKSFYSLVEEGFVQVYYVSIQVMFVQLFHGKVNMMKFVFKEIIKISNFTDVEEVLKSKVKLANQEEIFQKLGCMTERSITEQDTENIYQKKNPFSKTLQSAFSADFTEQSLFKMEHIKLQNPKTSEFYYQANSMKQGIVNQSQKLLKNPLKKGVHHKKVKNNKDFTKEYNQKNLLSIAKFKKIPFFIFLALATFSIVIYSQISLNNESKWMNQECKRIIKRQRSFSIYLKSVFNPNRTYIQQFGLTNLADPLYYLRDEKVSYTTYFNYTLQMNKFYLFNAQISAILHNLVRATGDKNILYKQEYLKNYNTIVSEYDKKADKALELINQKLFITQTILIVQLSLLVLFLVFLFFFYICMFFQYKTEIEKYESFFKFEKSNIDDRIVLMEESILDINENLFQWNIKQDFKQLMDMRSQQIHSMADLGNENGGNIGKRIKFDVSDERQDQIIKNMRCITFFLFAIFAVIHISVIAVYLTYNSQYIGNLSKIPQDLNKCSKLLILPNMQIANIVQPVEQKILSKYVQQTLECLNTPLELLPELFAFLGTVPCEECAFMKNVLKLNYRSFFISLKENVVIAKQMQTTDLSQMYYAADIVTDKLMGSFKTKDNQLLWNILTLFVFSLAFFFVIVGILIMKVKKDNEKVQEFMGFFTSEMIEHNKHLNSAFINQQ